MKRATLQEVGASTEGGSKRGRGEGGVMQVCLASPINSNIDVIVNTQDVGIEVF